MRLDDYMKLPYRITLEQDESDGQLCFMTYNPELTGCMAQGATPQEAVQNLKEARRDYINALLRRNIPVPLPENYREEPVVIELMPILTYHAVRAILIKRQQASSQEVEA